VTSEEVEAGARGRVHVGLSLIVLGGSRVARWRKSGPPISARGSWTLSH
jgi:hypothetical protein